MYRSASAPHLRHRQRSQNVVLLKDEIGKGKPACHDLPPNGHSYGFVESQIAGGVREAMTWAPHQPSPKPPRPDVDFDKLHKSAVTNRVTTPKKLAQFRSEGDFACRQASPSRTPPCVIPSDVIPGYAYGRIGRESTPIQDVLSHGFGNEWEEALDERYQRIEDHRAACDGKLHFKGTRAQRLKDAVNLQRRTDAEHPPVLWKMSKFQKTTTRLRKEAPLVRDGEGRLQRCSSPADSCPSPPLRCQSPAIQKSVVQSSPSAMRQSASLPELPHCSPPRHSSPMRQTVFESQDHSRRDLIRTHASLSPALEHPQQSQNHSFFGEQTHCRLPRVSFSSQVDGLEDVQEMQDTATFGQQDDSQEDLSRTAYFGKQDACDYETESECSGTPWSPIADLALDASVEHRSGSESDATLSAECESPASPSFAGATLVSISFTLRLATQEELHLAIRGLQGSIRSQFSDSVVKLGEWVTEQPRQALREKRQRYTAWGQKALDAQLGPVARPGPRPSVFSPMSCSLTVKHASFGELQSTVVVLVECIQRSLPEDILQVRKVLPAGLWDALPTCSPPRPRTRDGLGRPLLQKKPQVSYRHVERPCLALE